MTNYGYFDDERREYVVTNPKTPTKWVNYIGTLQFGGFVDNTGGLLICRNDPALNRIVKYIPQTPAAEFNGSTVYLRFGSAETGYELISPFFVPTRRDLDAFECRVGLGYSTFVAETRGIRTEITVFVPDGESVAIQDIRITNVSDAALDVDLIPTVEYTHPDALKQFTNADWVPQTMQSKVMQEPDGRLTLLQYPFMYRDSQLNFFTSSAAVDSFETDRERFLGDHGYGTWSDPEGLQRSSLSNYEALRGNNIGALLHKLEAVEPGETRRIIVLLGQAPDQDAVAEICGRFRDETVVDAAFEEIAGFWTGYLDRMQVSTPDKAMDRMLNVHNPRQCFITMNWSRYLSLYQLGLGARGIGFRDSSQDVMGVVTNGPAEGKALLTLLLQMQNADGSAMHQFNPMTRVANAGDSREKEDGPNFYSDDHLWAVLATVAYLQETGDFDFLQAEMPYYQEDQEVAPRDSGTVLDHLSRAVAFTRQTVGGHGLPLLGFADWNDTVNLPTGSESLFTANLYGRALSQLVELMQFLGASAEAQQFQAMYDEMAERVNAHAWDGDWYVRYFEADGSPIGSRTNDAGQLFANGQSWPVLSGFAPPERAQSALDSVYQRLNTVHGIKLSTPGYNGFVPEIGGVTTYPPGAKENGGIFLHSNPWVMMAETMLGNGERAYEYYSQINPAGKNEILDLYECEPYVYPQNVLGDEHPQFGLARNSWLTGTSSWTYQAGTQFILGIRPVFEGLLIDPCIPAAWDGFKVDRHFRGANYTIVVENPQHVSKGVAEVWLDGEKLDSAVLPALSDGQPHQVRVMMGEPTE